MPDAKFVQAIKDAETALKTAATGKASEIDGAVNVARAALAYRLKPHSRRGEAHSTQLCSVSARS